jgi:hypothetical protein
MDFSSTTSIWRASALFCLMLAEQGRALTEVSKKFLGELVKQFDGRPDDAV